MEMVVVVVAMITDQSRAAQPHGSSFSLFNHSEVDFQFRKLIIIKEN